MTFNEYVARGTGQILVKNTLTGQSIYTLDVTNSSQVTLSANQIGLVLPAALSSGTDYHVEIPSGAIVDLASPPNPYAGLAGSSAWNFTTAVVVTPPRVVVNKYLNGSPDRVELLVIGNGTPGSTVDLRGMLLKDFSGDISGDAGGKLVFANTSLWSAVAAGTLVTLSNSGTSSDVAASDYKLAVGLGDPSYFSLLPGSPALDITATDMVMIKDAGSDPAGTTGGIHALAAGAASPTSFFTLFPGAKLRAPATTGANLGVLATNSSSSQTDFMSGTDATGNLPLALSDFGAPNNGPNAAYIAALRGRAPGDGDGVATVVNATLSSPFLGIPMFARGQTNQSAQLTLVPRISGSTLSTVRIEVPSQIGAPGTVALSGPGAVGASFTVTGQTIDITSASATTVSPLEVTIAGLTTPSPVLASDNGNYPLVVSTSASGGTLTPIASQASVRVIIPIASLRDVDGEGVSLDAGSVVAVEGTVTEADFGGGAANFSGFLEDGTGGMNVFSPSLFLGLVRANVFAVVGTVFQSNGLTSIVPSTASHLVNLQTVPEPTAVAVTLAVLNANPEAFEGKLVKVANLRARSHRDPEELRPGSCRNPHPIRLHGELGTCLPDRCHRHFRPVRRLKPFQLGLLPDAARSERLGTFNRRLRDLDRPDRGDRRSDWRSGLRWQGQRLRVCLRTESIVGNLSQSGGRRTEHRQRQIHLHPAPPFPYHAELQGLHVNHARKLDGGCQRHLQRHLDPRKCPNRGGHPQRAQAADRAETVPQGGGRMKVPWQTGRRG